MHGSHRVTESHAHKHMAQDDENDGEDLSKFVDSRNLQAAHNFGDGWQQLGVESGGRV